MSEEKAALRKLYKEKAELIQNREGLSAKIAERLFALDEYKDCPLIFAYFSLPTEVSTKLIFEKAKNDGKKIALPRCEEAGNKMSFFPFESEDDLSNGRFGSILEPKGAEPVFAQESTLLLVPALAFGKNGSRLGRGMGFYDRFLSSFKGKTVGLCFEECLSQALPEEDFDRRVRIIITENETLFI